MTAFARQEDAHRALTAGFDGYERKPIGPTTLVTACRTLLDGVLARPPGRLSD